MEILLEILKTLSPVLVAMAVYPVLQLLKKGFSWLDKQQAWVKQMVAAVLGYGATKALALWGVVLPVAADQVTNESVTALLGTILAMLIRVGVKSDQTDEAVEVVTGIETEKI